MDTLDNTQEDLDNIKGSLDNADEDKKKALYIFYGVVALIVFLIVISLIWSFFILKNSSENKNISGQGSAPDPSNVPLLTEEDTPKPSNTSTLTEDDAPEPSDVPLS
jgi:flagellar basal body-associated protein FliL|tara:strand:- start:25 stop:345 length:321 start_codon:yes stop_codon:yes gene_type:complete